MRGGHRLALVCIASVGTALGSSPALADDGPIATVASVVQGSTSATSIDDPVDSVGTVVDTVSSTTSPTVGTVSSTTSATVGTVSNAASGTTGAIGGATSGASQSVSGSSETLTGAAADGTEALGSEVADDGAVADSGAETASGTTEAARQPRGSSAHTVTSSNSTQGVDPLAPHGEPTLFPTLQEQGQPGTHGEGPCSDPASPACAAAAGVKESDSLAEKVAKIIGLLAVTGLRMMPWVAAALILTIVGSLALERGRPRRSKTAHATQA